MRVCKSVLIAGLAASALLCTTAARAACLSPPLLGHGGKPCNGCRYEGAMSTSRGQACDRPWITDPTDTIAIISNRVTQRAKHGIAGASANTWAYQPAPGFVGTDDFSTEARFKRDNESGSFIVHWTVTVQ
jgi:hypothetical protein